MIGIKVRAHGYGDTVTQLYRTHVDAVRSIEVAAVDKADAARLVHRELFAYIGMHPASGRRFAIWRTTDREEA